MAFCLFRYSPKTRFDGQNGGNTQTNKIWQRYTIFQKFTLLWGLQVFWKKYLKSFNESEPSFIRSFRLNVWQKPCLSDRQWTQEHIQSFRKDRPYGPEGIHRILRQLVEHLNGEHTLIFCGIMIPVLSHNQLIVSAIRNEIASRLDIDSFQEVPGFTLETLSCSKHDRCHML